MVPTAIVMPARGQACGGIGLGFFGGINTEGFQQLHKAWREDPVAGRDEIAAADAWARGGATGRFAGVGRLGCCAIHAVAPLAEFAHASPFVSVPITLP